MLPRVIASCLALLVSGSAVAAPAYPVRMKNVARKKLAALEAEFRARNSQSWVSVEVDPRGFVTRVITKDPSLAPTLVDSAQGPQWSPADFERLRDFLRSNAALFGIDPRLVDKLRNAGSHLGVEERIGGAVLAAIDIQYEASPSPRLDIIVRASLRLTPTVTAEQVTQRLDGAKYKQTVGFGSAPHLDCGLGGKGPHGRDPCGTRTLFTEHRDVTLTASATFAHVLVLRRGDTYRLVACADAKRSLHEVPERVPPNTPDDLMVTVNRLAPIGRAPALPLIVDLVTGRVLPTRAAGCTEFEIAADRD